jgi:hypothetical protein
LPIQLLEATAACRRSPRSGSLPVPFPQELRDSPPRICPKDSMCRTIAKDRARSCRLEATLISKRNAGAKDRAGNCRLQATPIQKSAASGSPGSRCGHIDRFAVGVAASAELIPRARRVTAPPAKCAVMCAN